MDCWQLLRNPWWKGMTVPWGLSLAVIYSPASTALAQTQVSATQNATYSLTCATPRAHSSKLRSLHWPPMDSQGDCMVLFCFVLFSNKWRRNEAFSLRIPCVLQFEAASPHFSRSTFTREGAVPSSSPAGVWCFGPNFSSNSSSGHLCS